MAPFWSRRVAGVLLLTVLLGVVGVLVAPDERRFLGLWPVGLAAGALIAARREARLPVLVAIFASSALTVGLRHFPLGVTLGQALTITLESWVVANLLRPAGGGRPSLRSDPDLARFLGACLAGATVGVVGGVVTAVATGHGVPTQVGLTALATHGASLLVLLPFFAELHDQGTLAGQWERWVQRTVLLVVTPLFLTLSEVPLLIVLVIPVLAWGALKTAPLEAVAQVLFVQFCAVQLSRLGLGPLGDVPVRYGLFPEASAVLIGLFAVTCSLVVLPLSLRVGQHLAATRAAAAERDVVRSIVDGASGVAIIGTDERGLITLFNPGAERLLGYHASEALGTPVSGLYPPEAVAAKAAEHGLPPDFRALAFRLSDPGVGPTRIAVRRKDGEQRLHLMTLSRLEDDRGVVTGFVSTSEDVTELLEVQQRLEDSLRIERAAVDRLRQVDEVKDAFVSSVSHELRTPITSIVGYLEMLQEGSFGELSPQQGDAVERIHVNTARLRALIDDLLTLSRVQEQQADDLSQELDLRDAVVAAHELVAPAWAAPRVLDVRLALPAEPVPITGDRDALERVVMNLLGNAVKFTPDGGSVDLRLTLEDGWLAVLEVSDTGIGIPAEEEHLLFARFFRASSAQRSAVPGTGLGLAITRTIVEKHDGTISVRARPGGGTTFTVRLPSGIAGSSARLIQATPSVGRTEPER